jgi:predicted nucleotide-binding protein
MDNVSDKILITPMSTKKPRLFVGSSVENLKIAYAVQENLDQDFEVTVWNQSVFELSMSTLEALVAKVRDFDAAVFIFSPDDVAHVRGEPKQVIRDNVIFELGLFIGRLGRERTFIIVPRGTDNLHMPSDLLGITVATYEAVRSDKNWNAALGPACNQIRKAVESASQIEAPTSEKTRTFTDQEIIAILNSWLGNRPADENRKVLYFDQIDRELGLPLGSAAKHLEKAGSEWYEVKHKGPNLIHFKERPYDLGSSRGDRFRGF